MSSNRRRTEVCCAFARHAEDHSKLVAAAVNELQTVEMGKGYDRLTVYASFAERVRQTKRNLLSFLIQAKRDGRRIVGYALLARAIRC